MIVEIIQGIGQQPIVVDATQVVVRDDKGTPMAVAADFGPEDGYAVSVATAKDFNRILRALGVEGTTIVHTLQLPEQPQGARLIAGPTGG